MEIAISQKIALSVNEAAALIGVRRSYLYKLVKTGKLRARKSGARTLFTRADLESYVASLPAMHGDAGDAA